jgi:hypothetical protein
VKKEEAIEAVDKAGLAISEVNSRMWMTALNPSAYGWGPSLLSIASIPIVNAASIGQLVTSVIVQETPASVFDKVSNLTGKKGS